jgi:hypothetical protein
MRLYPDAAGLQQTPQPVLPSTRSGTLGRAALLTFALGGLLACSPALNWREVRPEDSQVQLLFPCKPVAQARQVTLAGQLVRLSLLACNAGGQTWALAHADLGDPRYIGAALTELMTSAAANLGTVPGAAQPLQVAGATPHAGSSRLRFAGTLPDGTAVTEEVAVFTYGTRVYQVTALGAALPQEAAQTFIASLRAGS